MKRYLWRTLYATTVFAATIMALGQGQKQTKADAAIRRAMEQSAANWNKGDLQAFAHLYKKSPDIIVVGPHNQTGYDAMLMMYQKNYPSAAARGTLTYSDLDVQPLSRAFATTTGRFHLERTSEGGGNQDGYFLVVFEKTSSSWKMVRDASFLLPPTTKKP